MKDPGIEEVRQARHEISRECGHDLHKVASYYRKVEEELRQSGRFQFEEPPAPPNKEMQRTAGSRR